MTTANRVSDGCEVVALTARAALACATVDLCAAHLDAIRRVGEAVGRGERDDPTAVSYRFDAAVERVAADTVERRVDPADGLDPVAVVVLQADGSALLRGQCEVGSDAAGAGNSRVRFRDQALNQDADDRKHDHDQSDSKHLEGLLAYIQPDLWHCRTFGHLRRRHILLPAMLSRSSLASLDWTAEAAVPTCCPSMLS